MRKFTSILKIKDSIEKVLNKFSIFSQVIILVILFSSIMFAYLTASNFSITRENLKQSEKHEMEVLLNTLTPIIAVNLSLGFDDAIVSFMNTQHLMNKEIVASVITDKNGAIIYGKGITKGKNIDSSFGSGKTEAIVDLDTKEKLGEIFIVYSNKHFEKMVDEYYSFVGKSIIFFLVFIIILIILLVRSFNPLLKLTFQLKEYSPASKNIRFQTSESKNEIGTICNALASMVERINYHTAKLEELNLTLEQKVEIRTRQLRRANEAKSIFLSNMSHEIRTPMNSILGYAQILSIDPSLDAKQKKAVTAIVNSGQNLLGLIGDILDFSKIEAGYMELNPTMFNLISMMQNLYEMFEDNCNKNGITLELQSPPEQELLVYADRGKLFRSLVNIVGNATKFTNTGGKITIRLSIVGNWVFYFEVEDSGIGMPNEDLDRIFDPFCQQKEGTKRGGTGLGLAITKKNIELMGGNIEVKSQLGVGSIFSFELYLQPSSKQLYSMSETNSIFKCATPRLKVLVADDSKEGRDAVGEVLLRLGLECFFAENGEDAMWHFIKEKPKLVFLDLIMPKLNGVETAQKIKEIDSSCKIVAITAYKHLLEGNEHGSLFDFVLLKPFSHQKIYDFLLDNFESYFLIENGFNNFIIINQKTTRGLLDNELAQKIIDSAKLGAVRQLRELLKEVDDMELNQKLVRQLENFNMDLIILEVENFLISPK